MTRNAKIAAAVAVAVAVLTAAVLISRGRSADTTAGPSTGPGAAGTSVVPSSAGPGTTAAPAPGTTPDATAPDATAPASTPASDPGPSTPPTTEAPKPLPVQVSVSNTNGLGNGQPVLIHVVPVGGSQAFAFEAYQCKAGETYRTDADIRPTQTGKCSPKAFSSSSDQRVEVAGEPPYQVLDGEFRVGTGTVTFNTVASGPSTITCGPGNPCVLVLKLQYPDGFGFQAIPITFG